MAYRNGTYVAFHANGTNIPGQSDIKYYQLMRAWSFKPDDEFTLVNSHEKASAVRDTSQAATLRRSLHERLANSKNMVLIIGGTTKSDTDWVPFEIENAVDKYKIPIIATYVDYDKPIRNPAALVSYWPEALKRRIENGTANVIHVPFKKTVLMNAMGQFSHNNPPPGKGYGYYSDEAYKSFGIEG
ncbi:TIR domain-containing protein [Rugamonas sp. CCM 8940]|uniref:TIR domain-containing protein n=1 Tax=Rugamonas sp. CCM 8940 TaxID=2765359 RepID=UPI0018F469F4|nr:TIR domain-containing protein [Rugamonas sp. CCM 8940]MBJ7308713.1 TIR domain-containing protein [Rugamonas sp. CCM 8940]